MVILMEIEEKLEYLLKNLHNLKLKELHIDNINHVMVNENKTKMFEKYLTAGSIVAMCVESFDEKVIKVNNLR